MHRTDQGDRRIPVRQDAQEFAEGACRLLHALPDAALIDRNSGQGKSCLAELRKVIGDQFPPLLPLAALHGKAGGHFAHIFQDGADIHRSILLIFKMYLVEYT
jgi:hypothetical protein